MITPRQSSVAIVGGRIGGLAAALSRLRAGFDVQVYEQAAAHGEVGARINIGPNASLAPTLRESCTASDWRQC